MNFKSINKFSVIINLLSGNLLPVNGNKNSEFSLPWKIYGITIFILGIIYFYTSFMGLILIPKVEALQYGTVNIVVVVECSVLTIYINYRRNDYKKLIKMINDILRNSDEQKVM